MDDIICNCISRVLRDHAAKHGAIRNVGVLQKELAKELDAVMKPRGSHKEVVSAAVEEFISKEGVQRYAGGAESVLRACLTPIVEKLYRKWAS